MPPPGKKTVTLKDIAREAGVSPGAVSFVLNNSHEKHRISKPTADRVRRIAKEMGYHPNIAARNLRFFGPGRNQFVLAIVTSADSPLNQVSHVLEALQRRIHREKDGRTFVTNIVTFKSGALSKVPGFLDGSLFNAAIIANTQKADDAFLAQAELPFPSILIGREIPGYSSFVPSLNAGRVAAKALLAAGSRKPAILMERDLTQATEKRVTQFTDDIAINQGRKPARIICRIQNEAAAHRAVLKSLKEGTDFDSLFAVHDNLAVGAYLAVKEMGLKIPGDVKVIGIGDSELAPYLDPPLTCAGAEESQVYDRAAALMLERLDNDGETPRVVRTRARIIKRGSL
jgi:LacI family transcriptional regulator